jgi:hypothetical protein
MVCTECCPALLQQAPCPGAPLHHLLPHPPAPPPPPRAPRRDLSDPFVQKMEKLVMSYNPWYHARHRQHGPDLWMQTLQHGKCSTTAATRYAPCRVPESVTAAWSNTSRTRLTHSALARLLQTGSSSCSATRCTLTACSWAVQRAW